MNHSIERQSDGQHIGRKPPQKPVVITPAATKPIAAPLLPFLSKSFDEISRFFRSTEDADGAEILFNFVKLR